MASVESAVAAAPIAPVLGQPSVRAEQMTQLVLGETVAILDRQRDWYRVRLHADGYVGWVHRGYLLDMADADADAWRARATGWSEGALLEVDGRRVRLPLRARVALNKEVVCLPGGLVGRVVTGGVREAADVIGEARGAGPECWALAHFEGAPYQWGGVTECGVDCSGLVQTTFAARGIALPRDSSDQAREGSERALHAVRPGDLLFFRAESGSHINHVAFAGVGDTLVHATLACGRVLIEPWTPGTRAAPLRDRLVAARHLEERGAAIA